MRCPNCSFENVPQARYCGHCGLRLVYNCQVCGLANPVGYHFCHQCGAPLNGDDQVIQPQSPAPMVQQAPKPEVIQPTAPTGTVLSPDKQPAPESPAPEDRLQGERRVATIVMADVRGSTDLLERLGTETWVEVMNHIFQILESEIYRFGGNVDQFRGDGLVAFFGASGAHEDDPERAVLASLAMQKAVRPYAAELAESDGIDLSMRVGVNTGEVIVTSVGDRNHHSEDTAMGEAIALAARMESAAEPSTVLVSDNTYRLVKEQFEWHPLGEITVKGISYPIAVYRPLRSKGENERADAYQLGNPLIGRDTELKTLMNCIEDLQDGLGGIVTLSGEKGMGKSLLLNELRHHLLRKNALRQQAQEHSATTNDSHQALDLYAKEPQLLRGRCRSYNQSQPYAVWLDLLYNWLGVHADEAKAETLHRLQEKTEALWGENAEKYYPHLAALLSLPLEDYLAEHINQLDAEGRRQGLFLAIREWVEALACQAPVVISFSDMHWIDTTSLDLLKYCLPTCDYAPILWILVFRPERESPIWKLRYYLETDYPHRLTVLPLTSLDDVQSQQFITHLVGPDVLPPETQQLIIDKAEGNPYYIQELVRSLIAQGALVATSADDDESDGCCQWHLSEAVTSLDLPDSLQTLLLARIDRLSAEEHQVLQAASVIGPVFWSNVLQALFDAGTPLHKHITTLLRAQLIRERGRAAELGVEYVFKSPLIRDAAYDSLLHTQRSDYHINIAQYFETNFDETALPQHYGTLAHHYRGAGQTERELFYTLKNAEEAKQSYANIEASELYTHALALLTTLAQQSQQATEKQQYLTQRFEILHARREVFEHIGQFDAMWEDAKALLPLARQFTDAPGHLVDAILQQPGVANQYTSATLEAARPMTEEALALARQLGDKHREMLVLIAIANQRLSSGDTSWQRMAEQALDLARQTGDQRYEARLLIGLGRLYASTDQPERSMEYAEAAAALSLSQALDDRRVQTSLLALLGLELERNGDYYRLLTEYQEEQLHISREIGHRPMESKALMACGLTQALYLGDYEAGLHLLEQCHHILEGSQDEAYVMLDIAYVLTIMGEHEEAKTYLDHVRHSDLAEHKLSNVGLKLVEIIFYNALSEKDKLYQALEISEAVQSMAKENALISRQYEMAAACKAVHTHLQLARLVLDPTKSEVHQMEALTMSRRALEIYQSFGYAQINESVSEEILFRHSQALAANGYEDEAIKYLRWAYDEMIRKYALIPTDSAFRRTYLESIPLHKDIRIAYAARVGSILTETGQLHPALKSGAALRERGSSALIA